MSVLLIGDASTSYTHANLIGSSAQEAWKFTALETGTVTELRFRTNGNTNSGTTQVEMGVYSDVAGEPDTLLGSGVVAGQPATNSWISVTGLSIPVVEGTDYWLAADPAEGGLHFNTAVLSGGTPDWAVANGAGPLTATWDVGSSDPDYADGPIGFQGLGTLTSLSPDLPAAVDEPVYIVRITPLLRPDSPEIGKADTTLVTQFEDLEVVHALNGGKTAQVTISMELGAWVADLEPWAQALWVGLVRPGNTEAEAVFHGQCNVKDNYTNGTIFLEAQDPSQRMQHHYLVQGDVALAATTDDADTGVITADGEGVSTIAAAAQNTTPQTTRDMPVLGLQMNFDTSPSHPFYALQVERGQEVDSLIQAVASHAGGPDLDYRTPGDGWPVSYYAKIDAYEALGRDLTADITLSFGYVEDNVEGMEVNPTRPTTHCHFLDADRTFRRTAAHLESSNDVGAWVDFVVADMVITTEGSSDILLDLARARVASYGRPPKFTDPALRPDKTLGLYYGHPTWTTDYPYSAGQSNGDVYPGDTIRARGQRGYRSFDTPARITQITLSQPGARGPARMAWKLLPVVDGVTLDDDGEQG